MHGEHFAGPTSTQPNQSSVRRHANASKSGQIHLFTDNNKNKELLNLSAQATAIHFSVFKRTERVERFVVKSYLDV